MADQTRIKDPVGAPERVLTPLFLLIMLSTLAYFISVGALQPTLPRFVEGPLSGGDISVGLAIGAFAFSAVLIRPLVGPLGDKRGRRLLIVLGARSLPCRWPDTSSPNRCGFY